MNMKMYLISVLLFCTSIVAMENTENALFIEKITPRIAYNLNNIPKFHSKETITYDECICLAYTFLQSKNISTDALVKSIPEEQLSMLFNEFTEKHKHTQKEITKGNSLALYADTYLLIFLIRGIKLYVDPCYLCNHHESTYTYHSNGTRLTREDINALVGEIKALEDKINQFTQEIINI